MEKEMAAQPNFEEIAEVVIRRINLFIVPLLAIFITTIFTGSMLPKTYETSALVEVRAKSMVDSVVKEPERASDADNEFEAMVKQITAWPRLEQLAAQMRLADNSSTPAEHETFIKAFKNRIRFGFKNKNIVEISYQDRDPINAQKVVNALAGVLIEKNDSIQKEEAKNTIDFIQQQLIIYRRKLDSSQQNVSINKIDSDMTEATDKKIVLLEKLESIQKIVPAQITNDQNSAIAQMQSRMGQLEMELARVSYDAKEGNPKVLGLKQEIQSIKTKIDAEMEKSNIKENTFMLNPMYLQTKQELKQVEMELDYLHQRKKDFEGQGNTPPVTMSEEELANVERNRMVDEDIYKVLLKQLEAAYVSERLQYTEKGKKYSVLEYARLPLRPVKPKMGMIAFMGLALGTLSGLGLVFGVENISGAFQTKEQVQDLLDIPFLSSISKMVIGQDSLKTKFTLKIKEKFNKLVHANKMLNGLTFVSPHIAKKLRDKAISAQVVVFHEPNCAISDEFRVLRTHIFHSMGEQTPPKTLILTSTLKGEGKSTTAANLAVAIADSGRRTLLMDCDLRKGTIAGMFSLPQSKGVIDVISGGAEIDSAIKNIKVSNLSIMPSGGSNERPSELLDSPAMTALIKKLKERYDYIIIDSPPIINMPDASVMSRLADAVIVVIQAGRAKKRDVMLAKEKLEQVDTRIAGFVLTNVQYYMPRCVYDYYYKYY